MQKFPLVLFPIHVFRRLKGVLNEAPVLEASGSDNPPPGEGRSASFVGGSEADLASHLASPVFNWAHYVINLAHLPPVPRSQG